MTDTDAWPAPAKINLFLHIIGRRPDGYHRLQTAFQFLDYGDTLRFEPRSDGVIRRVSVLDGIPAEDDLVVAAAKALQRHGQTTQGADIFLDKRIPVGGGLGGGSSDAATALAALNRLWGLKAPREQLAELGLALGADVPVFVHGHAAWAEGVGERLTRIDPDQPWYLVIKPGCSVATAEVFADADLTRDTAAITIRDFVSPGTGHNDCEAVVRRRYPPIAAALDWLGKDARLTGTGACVFRPYGSETAAQTDLGALPADWSGFVAKGLNRSPLEDRLATASPFGASAQGH